MKQLAAKKILIIVALIIVLIAFMRIVILNTRFSQTDLLVSDMDRIGKALENFKTQCNRYPYTEEGLAFLNEELKIDVCVDYPDKGFFGQKYLLIDPWEDDYIYKSDGKSYSLISMGGSYYLRTSESSLEKVEK